MKYTTLCTATALGMCLVVGYPTGVRAGADDPPKNSGVHKVEAPEKKPSLLQRILHPFKRDGGNTNRQGVVDIGKLQEQNPDQAKELIRATGEKEYGKPSTPGKNVPSIETDPAKPTTSKISQQPTQEKVTNRPPASAPRKSTAQNGPRAAKKPVPASAPKKATVTNPNTGGVRQGTPSAAKKSAPTSVAKKSPTKPKTGRAVTFKLPQLPHK